MFSCTPTDLFSMSSLAGTDTIPALLWFRIWVTGWGSKDPDEVVSGFWGITAAGLLAFFPSLHQRKLRGFICTCMRHCFYKSDSTVPACTLFSDMTSHFWVDDWEMFFCLLLKEAQRLLKKLLSVLNLLLKDSRSCNYNTALMTVSGLIFCFIAAWGREGSFFLYCFCPVVSPASVYSSETANWCDIHFSSSSFCCSISADLCLAIDAVCFMGSQLKVFCVIGCVVGRFSKENVQTQ